MTEQLPLALRWPPHQRFEHFLGADNAPTVATLERVAMGGEVAWPFLAGSSGCGKTHLLIAACQAASQAGRRVQYLPLAAVRGALSAALRASAGAQVLALDDVQQVAGDADAEHALFDLYNHARADGTTVVFAAREVPARLGLGLPDLRSRLGACMLLPLKPLDESQRREVLRRHAAARGIRLEAPVLDWLFTHHARDLGTLHALLDHLDRASLAAHRRVTIPFLRQYLRQQAAAAPDDHA